MIPLVLIPFLSGLFFQRTGRDGLNQGNGLNPLSIGSVFPTEEPVKITGSSGVLIPFLSGLFFQRAIRSSNSLASRLNPLSIGSVFPTEKKVKTVLPTMS